MQRILFGTLLSLLLIAQAAKAPLMVQWQQLANESFSELFCVNRALEDIPMCQGSCQLTELFAVMDSGRDQDGLQQFNTSLSATAYCLLPAPRTTSFQRANPGALPAISPTVPRFLPGDFTGALFEPPARG